MYNNYQVKMLDFDWWRAGNILYVMLCWSAFTRNVALQTCGPDQNVNKYHMTIDSIMCWVKNNIKTP